MMVIPVYLLSWHITLFLVLAGPNGKALDYDLIRTVSVSLANNTIFSPA
jgi:hypothetical protein